jgi:hypothetical protein|tara:strand:- start:242 stop:367 length:126 start_codon:yes stop_codon:yes gene_type:complete
VEALVVGDDVSRLCGNCQKSVVDLSAMTVVGMGWFFLAIRG